MRIRLVPTFAMLTLISIGIFLTGCDEPSTVQPAAEDNPASASAEPAAEKVNAALDAMAKDVAASLRSESVRTLVKQETGRLLANQHNVLYETIASKSVGGTGKSSAETFEEVLARNRVTGKSGGPGSLNEAVSRVRADANAIPKFDIGVPVQHESWDPKTTTPLVAFHHKQQVDDTELDRVKAYDAQGNVHWLDAQEAPDRPVVVVGINERTTADGQVKKAYRTDRAATKAIEQIDDGGSEGGSGGGDGGGDDGGDTSTYSTTDRNDGDEEYIEQWTCKDDEEPWIREGAEIYAQYVGISSPESPIITEYFGELDDGETRTVDEFILTWDWSNYGQKMGVFWYESDGGYTVYRRETLYQTSFRFTYESDDDDLGLTGLDVDDPADQNVTLNKVDFVPAWK